MCGCYRKDEVADPQIYSAAVIAVLEEYSDEIVQIVTDPRTGLPSRCQWFPTIKEVRDACEELKDSMAEKYRRDRQLEAQLKDRELYEASQREKRDRTPEEQARIDAKISAVLTSLRGNMEIDRKRFEDRARAYNDALMLLEYAAAGKEPVYTADGRLISLSLLNNLNGRKSEDA